jgi:predicted RNA-binding protein with PUA-like domain
MPNYWILKTEPSTYSFDQLEREKKATWDGVKNPVALKHLASMKPGDQVMIYHTGDEKSVVGLAEIVSQPYPDPKAKDAKLVVVDLKPVRRIARPVALSAIKAEPAFADLGLVRIGRLSVVPATEAHWKRLMLMGGG